MGDFAVGHIVAPSLDHTDRAQLDEWWVEMTRVLDELLRLEDTRLGEILLVELIEIRLLAPSRRNRPR